MSVPVSGSHNVVVVLPEAFSIALNQHQVQLFGISAEVITGTIVDLADCAGLLRAMYKSDTSESLIEYKQDTPGAGRDDLTCQTANAGAAALHAKVANANELIAALKDGLTHGAVEHNYGNKIVDSTQYTANQSFGDLLVEYIAHELFGHAQATAPISNDEAIVAYFMKDDVTAIGSALSKSVVPAANAPAGAQIASRLAKALYEAAEGDLQKVVEQVLAQAPERFKSEDSKNDLVPLEWKSGDVIYFRVNVDAAEDIVMGAPVASADSELYNQAQGAGTQLAVAAKTFFLRCSMA